MQMQTSAWGKGVSQMRTKADKGEKEVKLPNFCGHPLWMASDDTECH